MNKPFLNIVIAIVCLFPLVGEAQMIQGGQITLSNVSYNNGNLTRNIGIKPYFPSDTVTNKKPMPLILDFAGSSGTVGSAIAGDISSGLNLTHVINPLTGDTAHMMVATVWDATINNPPSDLVIPQVLKYLRAHFNIDSTRIYAAGLSYGGLVAMNLTLNGDSVGKYFAAIYPMSAGANTNTGWFSPNSGVELQINHCMIWHNHGLHDGTVFYNPVATTYRDSILSYVGTNQYHLTTFTSGPLDTHGNWDLKTSDTLGSDLPFWSWSDGSTFGRGGKPFHGSMYNWFLLFTNELTPGGNAGNLTAMSRVANTPAKKTLLPIIISSVKFEWLFDDTYSLSFTASNSGEDKEYDVQESDDGINWKTVKKIPADGDRDYQEMFNL